ncbi:MAG: contractile injection system protein, VgrG/Pvc8 family [Myxococcales bacterium]|nr:contractile injection system protein, VgrG/Pvc8 family [Myxococcota bacterium]MDW8281062.1 contractile injection system protein, VgrG/Pvc8 family [Myxococcales bacterium]
MSKRVIAGQPKINIGGEIPEEDIEHFEIRADLDQPDMAEISLSNIGSRYTRQIKPGTTVTVKMQMEGEEEDELFKGRVTGINPIWDIKRAVSLKVWAMNDLHKLARERKTRTFVQRTVKQIVETIAGEHGLSAKFGKEPPTLKLDHLHQNNVTDLAYLRWLAARTGREILVEDNTLYFRKPEKDQGPIMTLDFTEEGKETNVDYLSLMLSVANQVQKVTVRGWDPDKKEVIVGEATNSPGLGGRGGGSAFSDAPNLQFFDVPVRSKEEADLIAKSIMEERQMSYIMGQGTARGNGKIRPGVMIQVKCTDPAFDGKYQVSSVRHSYAHSSGGLGTGATMGGYRTQFQLRRDASSS